MNKYRSIATKNVDLVVRVCTTPFPDAWPVTFPSNANAEVKHKGSAAAIIDARQHESTEMEGLFIQETAAKKTSITKG